MEQYTMYIVYCSIYVSQIYIYTYIYTLYIVYLSIYVSQITHILLE